VRVELELFEGERPGHPGHVDAGKLGTEAGLSLLELVIAMSVFVIVILGVVATIDSGLTLTRSGR
jgi:hypothetical protein